MCTEINDKYKQRYITQTKVDCEPATMMYNVDYTLVKELTIISKVKYNAGYMSQPGRNKQGRQYVFTNKNYCRLSRTVNNDTNKLSLAIGNTDSVCETNCNYTEYQ